MTWSTRTNSRLKLSALMSLHSGSTPVHLHGAGCHAGDTRRQGQPEGAVRQRHRHPHRPSWGVHTRMQLCKRPSCLLQPGCSLLGCPFLADVRVVRERSKPGCTLPCEGWNARASYCSRPVWQDRVAPLIARELGIPGAALF